MFFPPVHIAGRLQLLNGVSTCHKRVSVIIARSSFSSIRGWSSSWVSPSLWYSWALVVDGPMSLFKLIASSISTVLPMSIHFHRKRIHRLSYLRISFVTNEVVFGHFMVLPFTKWPFIILVLPVLDSVPTSNPSTLIGTFVFTCSFISWLLFSS